MGRVIRGCSEEKNTSKGGANHTKIGGAGWIFRGYNRVRGGGIGREVEVTDQGRKEGCTQKGRERSII